MVTWPEAKQACEELGSQLVIIKTETKQNELEDYLNQLNSRKYNVNEVKTFQVIKE